MPTQIVELIGLTDSELNVLTFDPKMHIGMRLERHVDTMRSLERRAIVFVLGYVITGPETGNLCIQDSTPTGIERRDALRNGFECHVQGIPTSEATRRHGRTTHRHEQIDRPAFAIRRQTLLEFLIGIPQVLRLLQQASLESGDIHLTEVSHSFIATHASMLTRSSTYGHRAPEGEQYAP